MNTKQRGFTILELLVVIVLMVILVGVGGTAALRNQLNEKRSGVTVREMMILLDASATYLELEGEWPDENDYCDDLVSVLTTQGYIAGIELESPWMTSYQFYCNRNDPKTLSITVRAGDNDWARYIAAALPASTILPNANGLRVRTTLSRSLLLAALTDKLVQFATYATNSDDRIEKPDCPAGYTPAIYAALSGMSQNYEAPPIGAAYIDIADETPNYWKLEAELTTTQNDSEPPGNRMQMLVITQCEAA